MLRGGRSSGQKDPNELDGSRAKVRHRTAEKGRRGELLLFGKSVDSRFGSMVYLPNGCSRHLSEDS